MAKSRLDGATLIRSIHGTLTLHSMRREQHTAEESVRKLSHAVEQSAGLVVVTNRQGIVEYVNPAFEALTMASPLLKSKAHRLTWGYQMS